MKDHRWLLIILLVGAAIRFAVFLFAQPWTPHGEHIVLYKSSKDVLSYHYLAHDLVMYGRYGGNPEADPWRLDPVIRPMGYALYIAFWYWLFVPRPWIVLLSQVILSIGSIWLAYSVTLRVFGEKAAIVAALLFAIYPNSILFSSTMMTETIYILFAFIFLYIYSVFKKYILLNDIKKYIFWSMIAGVSFAATVYIRVSTIYLILIFPIVIFSIKILSIRYKIAFLLLFYLSLFISITPYSAYMYQ